MRPEADASRRGLQYTPKCEWGSFSGAKTNPLATSESEIQVIKTFFEYWLARGELSEWPMPVRRQPGGRHYGRRSQSGSQSADRAHNDHGWTDLGFRFAAPLFRGSGGNLRGAIAGGHRNYTVSQRTQEIGLRMAHGAQLTSVRAMILGQTLELTLIGVGLGLAGACVLARFLASLLFGIGAYDPLTFLGVAFLQIAVAFAASHIPARRAMRVDPSVALRYE